MTSLFIPLFVQCTPADKERAQYFGEDVQGKRQIDRTRIGLGRQKSSVCAACHGPSGFSSNPLWPHLAGQQRDYLVKQLEAFRDGVRKDQNMQTIVANLSKEDILNLASYYASLKGGATPYMAEKMAAATDAIATQGRSSVSTKQKITSRASAKRASPKLVAAGRQKAAVCAACHGPQGISKNPAFPTIAGKTQDFIVEQVKAIRDGIRKAPAMAPVVKTLSDQDIQALAAYFSSQRPK